MVARPLQPLPSPILRRLRTWLAVVLAVLLSVAVDVAPPRADADGGEPTPPTTTDPTEVPDTTGSAPIDEPPATQPPATQPPATQPPATQPPATQPPASQPPAPEEPAATEPSSTEPPVTIAAPIVAASTTVPAVLFPDAPTDEPRPQLEADLLPAPLGPDSPMLLAALAGDPPLPSAPRNFAVSDRTDTEITFTWDPPIPNHGIDHYVVQWRSVTRPVWGEVGATSQPSITSITVPWSPAESGWFSVYGVTADGFGDRSDAVLVHRLPEPVGWANAVGFDGGVLVEWWEQSFAEWPGHRYRVEHEASPATWETVGHTQSSQLLITGLTNGETYRYRVIVEHDGAESAPSDVVEAAPDDQWALPPAAPALLSVAADIDRDAGRGLGDVDVAWPPPTVGAGQLPVAGYLVEYLPLPASDGWERNDVDDLATTHRLSLAPGDDYAIRVIAIDEDGGRGEPSNIIFVTVDAGAPTNLRVVPPGLGVIGCDNPEGSCPLSVRLAWDAPTGYDDIAGYRVEFQSQWDFFNDPNGWQDAHVELITATNATVSPRPMFADYPYLQYRFRVRAVNDDDVISGVSNRQQVTPEIPDTPGVPAPVVTVTGRGHRTADLAWPHVAGLTYEVYRADPGEPFAPLDQWSVDYAPGVGATVHDPWYSSGAVYRFAVVATDSATGETSALSDPVGVVFRPIPNYQGLDVSAGNGGAYIQWVVWNEWGSGWVSVRIERSATDPAVGATWEHVALADGNFWFDDDLVNGTTYWYRGRAEVGASDIVGDQIGPPVVSAWSAPLAVTPFAGAGAAPPGAPTLSPLALTWEGDTPVVDLQWAASTAGQSADYYVVLFRSPDGHSEWVDVPGTWNPWENQYLTFRNPHLAFPDDVVYSALHRDARSATVLGVPPGASIEFAIQPVALDGNFPPIYGMLSSWVRLDVPMVPPTPGALTVRAWDGPSPSTTPAGDAWVDVRRVVPDEGVGTHQLVGGSLTLADIDPGDYTLTFFSTSAVCGAGAPYREQTVDVTVGSAPVERDVYLERAWVSAAGMVGDVDGHPIDGAYVKLWHDVGEPFESAADATGSVCYFDLPTGGYTATYTADGFATGYRYVTVSAGTTTNLDIQLATAEPAAPGAPTDLRRADHRYIGDELASVLLEWSAPVETGAGVIDYVVEYQLVWGWPVVCADDEWRVLADGVSADPFVSFTTTEYPYDHCFRVRAVDSDGAVSAPSNVVVARPNIVLLPPTDMVAIGGDLSVALTWTHAAQSTPVPIPQSYTIEVGTSASGPWTVAGHTHYLDPAPTNQFTVTDLDVADGVATPLAADTTYWFRVRLSHNEQPYIGQWSAVVSATTDDDVPPATAPSAPTIVSAAVMPLVAAGEVRLVWTAAPAPDDHPVTGYVIESRSSAGGDWALHSTLDSPVLTHTFSATIGESVQYRVRGVNDAGIGVPSAPMTAVALGLPSVPRDFAVHRGNGTVTFSWQPPESTGGAASILYYRLERRAEGDSEWQSAGIISGDFVPTLNTPLDAPREYRLVAVTSAGESAATSGVWATIRVAPPQVTGVTGTPGNGMAVVSWEAVTVAGGAISYRVEQLGAGESGWLPVGTTTATELTVAGLTDGTTPTFRVVALNGVDDVVGVGLGRDGGVAGPASATIGVALPPTGQPPSAVQGLSGQRVPGAVMLTWRPPSSDGGALVTGYRVDRATSDAGPWTEVATLAADVPLVATVDGTVDVQLWFRVVALNTAGDGATTLITLTLRNAPTQVPNVELEEGSVVVTWDAATAIGTSPDISYHVERATDVDGPYSWLGSTQDHFFTDTGMTGMVTYWYRVYASNGDNDLINGVSSLGVAGVPSASASITPVGTPWAPTITSAAVAPVAGAGEVRLVWTAPDSDGGSPLLGYVVEYQPTSMAPGQPWILHDGSVGTATTATISGLTIGTQYRFRVRATNAHGTGAPSSSALATPAAAVVPSTPRGVTTELLESGDLLVSWQPPESNGGSPITGYELTIAASSGTGQVAAPASATSAVVGRDDHETLFGHLIDVTVTARNAVGQSEPSAPIGLWWAANPSSPLDVTAVPGNRSATVSWQPPADLGYPAGTPDVFVYYMVERRVAGGEWASAAFTTNLTHTSPNLTNGTTYEYRVRARTNRGSNFRYGEWSDPVAATPGPTVPSAPTATSVESYFDWRDIRFEWSPPATDGGSPVTGYELQILTPAGDVVLSATTGPTDGRGRFDWPAAAPELGGADTYIFVARAQNALGWSEPSAPLLQQVVLSPGPAQDVTVTPGDGQVTISWTRPENVGWPPGTQELEVWYRIYRRLPGGPIIAGRHDITETSFTWTELANGTTSEFTVQMQSRARPGGGTAITRSSEYSEWVAGTPVGPPTAPMGVTAVQLPSGDVQVSWSPPENDGGRPVTAYHVSGFGVPGPMVAGSELSTVLPEWAFTLGDVSPLQVRARNELGWGPWSEPLSFWYALEPSAPRNVTAVPGDRTATVTWQAPADLGFPAGTPDVFVYYMVERRVAGGNWALAALTTNLTHTSPNLTNGATYEYRVRARTNRGSNLRYGEWSALAAVTPAVPAVVAPSAPQAFLGQQSGSTITFTWEPPASDGGAPITGYTLSIGTSVNGPWTVLTTAAFSGISVGDMQPGQTRWFRVVARNSSGTGAPAVIAVSAVAAPGAPVGLGVAARGDGWVRLTWQNPLSLGSLDGSPGVSGGGAPTVWRVERAVTSAGPWTTVATTSQREYTVTGPASLWRSYRVIALNAGGQSPPSNLAAAIVRHAPGAVSGLVGSTPAAETVSLSWQPAGASVTNPITYRVERATSATGPWTSVGTVTSTSWSGPAPFAVAHHYRVVAVTGVDDYGDLQPGIAGPPSNAVELAADRLPGPVSNVTVSIVNGGYRLSWTPPGRDTGAAIDYEVIGSSVFTTLTPFTTAAASTYIPAFDLFNYDYGIFATGDPNLTNWQIRARGALGWGPPVNIEVRRTLVPRWFAYFEAVPGDSTIDLAWALDPFPGPVPFATYDAWLADIDLKVEIATGPDGPWVDITADVDLDHPWTAATLPADKRAWTPTITGLAPGNYWVRVTGTGTESGIAYTVSRSTGELVLGGTSPPRMLRATPGAGSAVLTWQHPADDHHGAVTGYVVEQVIDGVGVQVLTTALPFAEIGGLVPNIPHQFRVRASNGGALSPPAYITVTPLGQEGGPAGATGTPQPPSAPAGATVPSTPAAPTATAGHRSVTLSWSPPADDGGAPITHYIVQRSDDGHDWWYVGTPVTAPVTSLVDAPVDDDVQRRYRVVAVNGVGRSAPSADVPAAAVLPPTPTVTATPQIEQIRLDWTSATSVPGLGPVTGFVIERRTPGAGWAIIADVPVAAHWVDDAPSGTDYSYRVSARTADDIGNPSAVVTATPIPAQPPAPVLDSVVASTGQVTVQWSAPEPNGTESITGYTLQRRRRTMSWTFGYDGTTYHVHIGDWETVYNGGPSVHQYLDTAVAFGGDPIRYYEYQVLANNGFGAGEPSNVLGVDAEVAPLPNPVRNTTARASAPGAITITWTAGASTRNYIGDLEIRAYSSIPQRELPPVTEHRVQRSTDGTTWATVATVGGDQFTYTNTSVPHGQYRYRVIAVNAGGPSAPSSVATASSGTVPTAPQNVRATISWGTVTLQYDWPASDGGLHIDEVAVFEVRRGYGTGAAYETLVQTRQVLLHDDSTQGCEGRWNTTAWCIDEALLAPVAFTFNVNAPVFTTVHYYVRVRNDAGWSPPSPIVWVIA